MDEESEARLFRLLDTMSIEMAKIGPMAIDVAGLKVDVAELRSEARKGFDRIERRMGKLETRIEVLEDRHLGIETH